MTIPLDESRFLSRRDAIRLALGALGMSALGPMERAVAATAATAAGMPAIATQKFLVVVELDGGNDGLNMVVPQTLANYALRRPTIALSTAQTEALDTGPFATADFRLHGRMTRLAQLYRDGELGIVHKVGYPNANQSHDTSKQIWAAGARGGLLGQSGWIARYAALAAPTTLGAVSVRRGRHRVMTGGSSNPLTLDTLASFRFDNDGAFTANHRHRLDVVRALLDARASSPVRDALRTGHALADQLGAAVAGYTGTAVYGTAGIGAAMRDIATMLEAGFETRVFYTGFGGFDTHAGQGTTTGAQPDRLGELDAAVAGFADDCRAMGIWQNAVVLVISEFGRRNFENGSNGTDHGGANSVLVAGGAIQGGLHGVPPSDADLSGNTLPYGVDFRALYGNVLQDHLGLADPSRVFTENFTSPNPVDVV